MRMNFFFLSEVMWHVRTKWRNTEKRALQEQFKMLTITLRKTPSQSDCLNAIKAEKCWAVFSWSMEKYREEIQTTLLKETDRKRRDNKWCNNAGSFLCRLLNPFFFMNFKVLIIWRSWGVLLVSSFTRWQKHYMSRCMGKPTTWTDVII